MPRMGPFYCPNDEKVYIDLAFYDELKQRFGAPGDFAQAYVIAHEIGHHVQNLLGIADRSRRARQRRASARRNALRCAWSCRPTASPASGRNHAQRDARTSSSPATSRRRSTPPAAIGDDRIQKQTQGYVVPDSFTHGSSAQRVRWFKRGYQSGKLEACDTFNTDQL